MGHALPNILVTTGPTREFLDPTRFISNPSSGKMGFLIAREAKRKGCRVLLISGPTNLNYNPIKTVKVISALEMYDAVRRNFQNFDILIMAAAVSDYRPVVFHRNKIKKDNKMKTVKLVPNSDILDWAGNHKGSNILVGFAAETDQVVEKGRKKLLKKNLDFIVANHVGTEDAGFGSDRIEYSILDKAGEFTPLVIESKSKAARKIIQVVLKRFSEL